MSKTPTRRYRGLRRRERASTSQLADLYMLIQDIEEDILFELEARKKDEKEKEEKSKPKENFFTKKYTGVQLIAWIWGSSIALTPFHMLLWWKLFS